MRRTRTSNNNTNLGYYTNHWYTTASEPFWDQAGTSTSEPLITPNHDVTNANIFVSHWLAGDPAMKQIDYHQLVNHPQHKSDELVQFLVDGSLCLTAWLLTNH